MVRDIRAVDVVVAVASFVLLGVLSLAATSGRLVVAAITIAALATPLLFRRSAPVLSAAAIQLCSLVQVLVLGEPMPINLVVLISLYSVTVHGPRWASVTATVGALVGAWIFAWLIAPSEPAVFVAVLLSTVFAVLVAGALGVARRSRKERSEAERARVEALEGSRYRDAELAVAAERARIAREMHDVVAHSLAVIIAQADGGRYAARTSPEAGVKALDTIAEIGRDALGDIRRILGVLRSDDDGPIVRPQPTHEDLADVVARVRETGAHVAFTTIGAPRPLLPGMGLTLQRVCQEALTNTLKHGGPGARMSVALRWEADRVVLQVDDDGRGAATIPDGSGSGIVGMRERAQLFGGTLQAGPRPTGGYRVRLVLPLDPARKEQP